MSGSGHGAIWIVVPAYNEAETIDGVVRSLIAAGYPNVCVVDDGSADITGKTALTAGAHVLTHPFNIGQGAALQTGIQYVLGRGASYICTFDADGQHSAPSVATMCETLDRAGADVCLGSRFLGDASGVPAKRRLLLKAALLFTRLHTGLRLTDTHNGMRVFTRRAALAMTIRQHGMAHASEVLSNIRRLSLSYCEGPVDVRYTAYSRAKGQSAAGALRILADLLYYALALRRNGP